MTWTIYPDEETNYDIEEPAYNPPYVLDSNQRQVNYHIEQEHDVFVGMPTGAGKTEGVKYAIAKALRDGHRVIYTSPFKTISNQNLKKFGEEFGEDNIGICTGDNKLKVDAMCVIMTTEILRNQLFHQFSTRDTEKPNILYETLFSFDNVKYIVFDEVHFINDDERGHVWDECLRMIPNHINILMLSATLSNPELITESLGRCRESNVYMVLSTTRPVPLRHYVYDMDSSRKIEVVDEHNNFKNYSQCQQIWNPMGVQYFLNNGFIEYLQDNDLLTALFFCYSRRNCRNYAKAVSAKNLVDHETSAKILHIFDSKLAPYREELEKDPQFFQIRDIIVKGIGYHHAGLLPILKEVIEIIFTDGLIPALFATTTFALGVNAPVRTVVQQSIEKQDGRDFKMITPELYAQTAGRAGRRGMDETGNVIHLQSYELPSASVWKNIMTGEPPKISSKFRIDYEFIIAMICHNSNPYEAIEEFCSKTMYFYENENTNNDNMINATDRKQNLMNTLDATIMIKFSNDGTAINNETDEIITLFPENAILKNDENHDMTRYINMYNELHNSNVTLRANQMRKREQKLRDLQRRIPNFDTQWKYYTFEQNSRSEINELDRELENDTMTQIRYKYRKVLTFLKNNNFIDIDNDDLISVNSKCYIASVFHGVNPILMSESIETDLFSGLEFHELMTLLVAFLGNSKYGSDDAVISDMNLSERLKNRLHMAKELSENYQRDQNIDGLDQFIDIDWNIDLKWCEAVFLWTQNIPLVAVQNQVDKHIDSGDFLNTMKKLNQQCEIFMRIFEYKGDLESMKTIENFGDILFRDQITNMSIYIQT